MNESRSTQWQTGRIDWERSYLSNSEAAVVEDIISKQGIRRSVFRASDPLLSLATIPTLLTTIHDVICDYVERFGIQIPVYFCFVGHEDSNAFAVRLPKSAYCIAITIAMPLYLLEVSHSFLRCEPLQNLFSLEKNVRRYLKAIHSDGRGDTFEALKAVDSETIAKVGSFGLHLSALIAVIYHELGHIANGHLGLISNDHGGIPRLDLLQVLEFDADCTAVVEMLHQVGNGRRIPYCAMPFAEDADAKIRFAVLSLHIMFRALAISDVTENNWMQLHSHMPPGHRGIFLYNAMGSTIEKGSTMTFDEIENEIIDPVVLAVELSVAIITNEIQPENERETTFREVAHFQNQLLRNWSTVRPLLEKHKLGQHSLAPVQIVPD